MKIDSFQEFFDSVDGHAVPVVYDATWGIIKDWLESLKDEIDTVCLDLSQNRGTSRISINQQAAPN